MGEDTDKYYFDEKSATIAVNFFEKLIHHTTGEWAGEPFKLLEWQKERVIKPIFGWKRKSDNTRRYRTVYIEIPRKNGKSTLASAIALLLLLFDGEAGAQIYSAAADRNQANIVFTEAKNMIEASPQLSKMVEVFKNTITVPQTNSFYRVLSSDAPTKHGLNASGIIFDELHAQPNRELWDVLNTSTGARRQPLVVALTTAGFNRESVCYEVHEYAKQVESGIIEDDSFLPILFGADEDDDWLNEETWRKANPSLGATIKLDYLQQEASKAKSIPAYQNTFRRLHLNQWTQQSTRWLDMTAWDACNEIIPEKQLEGMLCYGGLDLASVSDIAAFSLVFPNIKDDADKYYVLPFFWIPEENLIERSRKDRVPYLSWVQQGLMRTTPGTVIDYSFILRDIEELGEKHNISEIAFDRWGAFQVSQTLQSMGFSMVAFGQGFKDMSPAMTEFMRLIMGKQLLHGGNPVLRWMADNLIVTTDAAGNVKPDKEKSRAKIDGIVSTLQALDRSIRHEQKKLSIYETRGLESV